MTWTLSASLSHGLAPSSTVRCDRAFADRWSYRTLSGLRVQGQWSQSQCSPLLAGTFWFLPSFFTIVQSCGTPAFAITWTTSWWDDASTAISELHQRSSLPFQSLSSTLPTVAVCSSRPSFYCTDRTSGQTFYLLWPSHQSGGFLTQVFHNLPTWFSLSEIDPFAAPMSYVHPCTFLISSATGPHIFSVCGNRCHYFVCFLN